MSAIRTENLSKTYKTVMGRSETVAVKMLSLEVKEGEVFGLLGPNGAGKTSTIHLLLNLIGPTSGAAFLFDRPVTETEVHRRVGYCLIVQIPLKVGSTLQSTSTRFCAGPTREICRSRNQCNSRS